MIAPSANFSIHEDIGPTALGSDRDRKRLNKQQKGPSPERKRTHDEQVKGMQFANFLQLRTLSFINTPHGYLLVMANI